MLVRCFFVFWLFAVGMVDVANAAPDNFTTGTPCGVNSLCPRGLYCSGAVGEFDSGICLPTGPYVVMCRLNKYLLDNLGKKFLIFGVLMVAIAFFLAKISWGMVVSVVLGAGIMYGSTGLVKKVSGRNTGFCEDEDVEACFTDADTLNYFASETVTRNTETKSSNLDPDISSCEPLECIKMTCKTYTYNTDGDCVVGTDTKTGYAPAYYGTCGNTTNCTKETISAPVDYFSCQNSCTGKTFSGSAPAGYYKNCGEFVKKTVQAGS